MKDHPFSLWPLHSLLAAAASLAKPLRQRKWRPRWPARTRAKKRDRKKRKRAKADRWEEKKEKKYPRFCPSYHHCCCCCTGPLLLPLLLSTIYFYSCGFAADKEKKWPFHDSTSQQVLPYQRSLYSSVHRTGFFWRRRKRVKTKKSTAHTYILSRLCDLLPACMPRRRNRYQNVKWTSIRNNGVLCTTPWWQHNVNARARTHKHLFLTAPKGTTAHKKGRKWAWKKKKQLPSSTFSLWLMTTVPGCSTVSFFCQGGNTHPDISREKKINVKTVSLFPRER